MITKSVLDHAKVYLCWDRFPELSIQLVELQEAVAFFYPSASQRESIVLFYQESNQDFREPLFLLFHEVGHLLQFYEFKKDRKLRPYRDLMEAVEGQEKVTFEKEAWERGRIVLSEFLQHEDIENESLIHEYVAYSQKCIDTYTVEPSRN